MELDNLLESLARSPRNWCADELAASASDWSAHWSSHAALDPKRPSQTVLPDSLLERAMSSVKYGRGLFLLRGVPINRMDESECEAFIRSIGSRIGVLSPMDADGSLVHRVEAIEGDGVRRGYQTRGALALHNDSCDFIVFLAMRSPRTGGERRVASAVKALHGVVARSSTLARRLCDPIKLPRYFNGVDATQVHELPLVAFAGAEPVFVVKPGYVRHLARSGVNPFRDEEHERAYDLFLEELNKEQNVSSWGVEIGDLEIYDNFRVLHARNAYSDGDNDSHRRSLLRVWVADPDGSPLPDAFARADDYNNLSRVRQLRIDAA